MGTRNIDAVRVGKLFADHPEAFDFIINHWLPYIHEIDDIVDGDRVLPEQILETFARAPMLYSHPFYLKHLLELRSIVLMVTNAFADTVAFEKSKEEWQRQWADHYRHVGVEMTIAIAQIVGGYAAARKASREARCICHYEHHDRDDKAV